MELNMKIAERISSGSFYLTVGQALALLLGLVFSIILARILGPDNYGLIGIALIYPSMFISLTDLGLNAVISRYSTAPSTRREVYVWSGIAIRTILAVIGGVVIYFMANIFASLLGRLYIEPLIRILALYTASSSILSTLYSAFAGLGRYKVSAFILILQYFLKGVLAVTLLFTGLHIYGVVLSYSIAYTILVPIFLILLVRDLKPAISLSEGIETLKVALPLYVAVVCDVFLKPTLDTTLSKYISNYEWGNYSVAFNVLMPIGVFSGAIVTATLTSLPLLIEDSESLKKNTGELVFYTTIVFNGLALLYLSILKPLVNILYGVEYLSAPKYAIAISASTVVPTILGSLVIGNYFITIKATRWNAIVGVIKVITALITSYVSIPILGVYGVALALLIGNVISTLIGYYILVIVYCVHVDLKKSIKASIPAFIAFTIAYTLINITSNQLLNILVGFATYIIAYLLLLPVFLENSVIKNVVDIASRLDYIGLFIEKISPYYLKVVTYLNRSSKKVSTLYHNERV
jgi:O-antigen/teichoic acid export membrane protein